MRTKLLDMAIRAVLASCVLCGVAAAHASAQSELEIDGVRPQLWLDYNPAIELTSRWTLAGDLGFRTDLKSEGWTRLVVRPGVEYRLSETVWVGGGVGNFFTNNSLYSDRWEIRPWQGINVTWPNWRLPLRHFLRLEERFDLDTESWTSAVSLRVRYLIGTSYRWGTFLRSPTFWEASASLEMFATLAGEQGQSQEQVRAALGLRRSVSRSLDLLFEGVWQKRGLLFISDAAVDDIFLRVRVSHDFMP